jgi:hypothetical protein
MFIEHLPSRKLTKSSGLDVRISANKKKLIFSAYPDFFANAGILENDKVKFFYDNTNPNRFKFEKTEPEQAGYKVSKVGNRLSITIRIKIPGFSLQTIQSVNCIVIPNGLEVSISS